VVQRIGRIRSEPERVVERAERLVKATRLRERKAKIGVPGRIALIKRYGAPDQFDGRGRIARLQFGDTKQMQGAGVVGMACDNLPVDRRSLRNAAAAMQDQRILQRQFLAYPARFRYRALIARRGTIARLRGAQIRFPMLLLTCCR